MGLDHKCHPNEGETSIDMRLAIKGLLQNIAMKIVAYYRNNEDQKNRMRDSRMDIR